MEGDCVKDESDAHLVSLGGRNNPIKGCYWKTGRLKGKKDEINFREISQTKQPGI